MNPNTSKYRVKEYKPRKNDLMRKPSEPFKPKIYDVADKELFGEHGPVKYQGADPNIDPLTKLPYNHPAEYDTHSTAGSLNRTTKSDKNTLPVYIGSPVKSISRTLKLIDSLFHQVDASSLRYQDLQRRHELRHKQPKRRQQ